ncbi:PTS system, nitrogen regulatory IIA component [Alkalispirochaeta americana]|uniref:PTS system, nitrogen regulatory IIA component n=1 Tax=Alkalispirochaeta americana TaxID=159291 RepID=A0A1N6RXR6_9SPIO|nr:PTS sugar transporter subunit IIA [Alkalispirochaeta americana]SIQ33539.1 PTS system, nitrogen regulatory IIA component [Alkalispirochaeta americana]
MYTGFFPPGSVLWDLTQTNKFDAIRETIFQTSTFRAIPGLDLETFTQAVIKREQEQSTGFGHGIAIAHGRTYQVPTSEIALGVSREGIDFQAFDGMPVHLLFVVASHPDRQIDYLRILSCLATLARNELFRQELLACLCQEEVEQKVCSAFQGALLRSHS